MSDQFDKIRESDKKGTVASDMPKQFLTFTVASEEYGVDIMTVREIKGWTETTRLPNAPEFMRGVINLRGLIIPIFDLRTRLSLGATDATPKHVVIIIAVGERNIGILVDAVSDILDVTESQIEPAPSEMQDRDGGSSASEALGNAAFISGLISLDDRMVVLLAVDHLFDTKHIDKASVQAV